MDFILQNQATTTPKIRAKVQAAPFSYSESAREYGVGDSALNCQG